SRFASEADVERTGSDAEGDKNLRECKRAGIVSYECAPLPHPLENAQREVLESGAAVDEQSLSDSARHPLPEYLLSVTPASHHLPYKINCSDDRIGTKHLFGKGDLDEDAIGNCVEIWELAEQIGNGHVMLPKEPRCADGFYPITWPPSPKATSPTVHL